MSDKKDKKDRRRKIRKDRDRQHRSRSLPPSVAPDVWLAAVMADPTLSSEDKIVVQAIAAVARPDGTVSEDDVLAYLGVQRSHGETNDHD